MARLRLEFFALGGGRGRLGGQVEAREAEPLAAATVTVTASPTGPDPNLVAPSGPGTVFADLTALDEPIYADVGPSPNPSAEPRLLLLPRQTQRIRVSSGDIVAAVTASDLGTGALPTQDQPIAVTTVDRSGTVTAGGVAQQACAANGSRRLLVVANPDDGRVFWFNLGAPAASGAGSLTVAPGAAFVWDKLVPSGTVSIYGAAAGQPFTVKEA